VPKRDCKNRAEWRLEPGKAAARLSAHYKLDCDFGTPVVAIYKAGDSSDPIYLCDGHVGEVRPAKKKFSDVRLIQSVDEPVSAPATTADVVDPKTERPGEDRVQAMPVAVPKAEPVSTQAMRPAAVAKIAPTTPIRATVRTAARDLTFGNSAKALVDEAIWNLATGDYELYRAALRLGKSQGEAAQAAGGQLAIVHRKICEYGVKIETVLAASTAKIDARAALDEPFERAMNEIMGNEAIADTDRDAALDELGALQQSVSKAGDRVSGQDLTPLQAHRIACAIGERAGWGTNASAPETLKPVYRALFSGVRTALRVSAPHANHLEERLTNLYAAKAELENGPALRAVQSLSA
jgi:hypothetical protein